MEYEDLRSFIERQFQRLQFLEKKKNEIERKLKTKEEMVNKLQQYVENQAKDISTYRKDV